jgi:hypothetical protein
LAFLHDNILLRPALPKVSLVAPPRYFLNEL